jgi:hypothetical protein
MSNNLVFHRNQNVMGVAVKLLARHTLPAIVERKVAYSITRHDLSRLGSALGYTSKSNMASQTMGLDTFLVVSVGNVGITLTLRKEGSLSS